VRISRAFLDDIVAHAHEELPNECCGYVGMDDGVAVKVFRTTNIDASPIRFTVDSKELYDVNSEIESQGWSPAIYHSHVRTAAYPSQTDVNFAKDWPGVLWLIVSLEDQDQPSVRVFEINDGTIEERELSVAD
jgi:[CysO sulfur-carrier protein]-S-L-cysteine hydrolase